MYICIILNIIYVEYIQLNYFWFFDKLLLARKMCYAWSEKCKTQTHKILQIPCDILYNSPVLKNKTYQFNPRSNFSLLLLCFKCNFSGQFYTGL